MRVSITGTPGVGKTTVSEALRSRGHDVIDLSSLIKQLGLNEDYDEKSSSFIVDVEKIQIPPNASEFTFIDGHLSHTLDVDTIIVIRCHPDTIRSRLEQRGYDEAKVLENVEAEVLDVILVESVMTGIDTYELDATNMDPEDLAETILVIINGEVDGFEPGKVDWSEVLESWV